MKKLWHRLVSGFAITLMAVGIILIPASAANAAYYQFWAASNSQTITVQNLDGHQFNIAAGNWAWDVSKYRIPAGKCAREERGFTDGSDFYYKPKSSVARWVSIPFTLVNFYRVRIYNC